MAAPASGRVLAVTGGHSFDLDAFRAMFDHVCAEHDLRWAHSVQPAAQRWLNGDVPFDAVVLHDIAGLHLRRGEPPRPIDPSPAVRAQLGDLLGTGVGLVVLHHSLASWPSWDGWADAIGGRFSYAPGVLHGDSWPSSGTRIDTYEAQVVAPEHPVCAGVGDFTLTDELYCCPVFEDRIVPLVRSNADFSPSLFISTYEHVVVGEAAAPRCDGHPRPSNLIAWATASGRSPIVYIQPGDSAATFALDPYRRLVGNALAWVMSPEARAWAERRTSD